MDSQAMVHDCIISNVFEALTKGPAEVVRLRAASLDKWIKRAKVLQLDESTLHSKCIDPLNEQVLSKKRLGLLQEMIEEAN